MADNQDRLRRNKVAQHVSVRREIARSSQTHVVSSLVNAEASTSGTHASLYSSYHRRHVSPTHAPEAPQASEAPE